MNIRGIQSAIDRAEAGIVARQPGGIGTYYGDAPAVRIERGTYDLTEPLRVGPYTRLVGDGTVLRAPEGVYAIRGSGWQGVIGGIIFDCTHGIDLDTRNFDQGRTLIGDCQFARCETAIRLDARSSVATIQRCKFDNVVVAMDCLRCDLLNWRDNWLSIAAAPHQHYSPIINRHGQMHLSGSVFVPRRPASDAFDECAWVSMLPADGHSQGAYAVVARDCRFGGEPGSMAAVNCFVRGQQHYGELARRVAIRDSMCMQVKTRGESIRPGAVRLFRVPNLVSLTGNSGFVDSDLVCWGRGVDPGAELSGFGASGNRHLSVVARGNVGGMGGRDELPTELEPHRADRAARIRLTGGAMRVTGPGGVTGHRQLKEAVQSATNRMLGGEDGLMIETDPIRVEVSE